MTPLADVNEYDAPFGMHPDRVGAAESPWAFAARRWAGRAPLDPFGLDAHLADLVAPVLRATVRVTVHGAHHIPASGPAALMMNRGLGVGEPTALTVGVMNETGRRVRVVGAPTLPVVGSMLRRFGAIATSQADVSSALHARHLVVVPLAPTWLRPGAGSPPLDLMQAIMGMPVLPVAVRPIGPFGSALRGWRVSIGAPVEADGSTVPGDPLGAAELSEAIRTAVLNLL